MKNVILTVLLIISVRALGQSTVQITCTTPSCGTTTLQSNGFSATGSGGAGGLSMTAGSPPSIPGLGLATTSITFFAPSTTALTTSYGVAPGGAGATGLWYGTLGSGASFSGLTFTLNSSNGITGYTGTISGGSGYFTPPPCYVTGTNTTQASCLFTVLNGVINGITFPVPGSGYTGTISIGAAPVLDLSYLTVSDPTLVNSSTGIINSGYYVQVSEAPLTSGDLSEFNSAGDLIDSGIATANVAQLGATGAFTTITGTSSLTLGSNGGTVGSLVLEGSTSGSATLITNGTAATIGASTQVEIPDNKAFVISQSTNSTGGNAVTYGAIGTGTTEAADVTGGNSTGLINTDNKCAFALTTSTFTLALSPVSICSFTLPNAANTWTWQCSMEWSNNAGTSPTFAIGVTWAHAPSAAFQMETIYTANASAPAKQISTTTTTNAAIGATGTLTTSSTLYQAFASGNFTASATSGTFSPTVILTGTGATGTATGQCMLL